jgi:hypothetical protein
VRCTNLNLNCVYSPYEKSRWFAEVYGQATHFSISKVVFSAKPRQQVTPRKAIPKHLRPSSLGQSRTSPYESISFSVAGNMTGRQATGDRASQISRSYRADTANATSHSHQNIPGYLQPTTSSIARAGQNAISLGRALPPISSLQHNISNALPISPAHRQHMSQHGPNAMFRPPTHHHHWPQHGQTSQALRNVDFTRANALPISPVHHQHMS